MAAAACGVLDRPVVEEADDVARLTALREQPWLWAQDRLGRGFWRPECLHVGSGRHDVIGQFLVKLPDNSGAGMLLLFL